MGFILSKIIPAVVKNDKTAFGELAVSNKTPSTQVSFQYGIRSDVFQATLSSGTVTNSNSMVVCSSGTSSPSIANATTDRQISVRPGQGIEGVGTAVFSTGVAGNIQVCGFITSENIHGFGYNGTSFGILIAKDGMLENQELQVTTPASGSENATITVSGTPYTVPLTSGTVQHNAYEISQSLNAQVPGYFFTSNDDTVNALSLIPFFSAGSFAFSSATAAATWAQITAQQAPTRQWIPQASWNVDNLSDWTTPLDPTKGNQYKVRFCSGFGAIKFFVEGPDGEFINVHTESQGNKNTTPVNRNPSFRWGVATLNEGNTTNVSVSSDSFAAFIEGKVTLDENSRAEPNVTLGVGTTLTNIATFRNRLTFNGKTNRSEIKPTTVRFSTDTSKTMTFLLISNATFSGDLDFNYKDEPNSLMEIANDAVTVTGGNTILAVDVKATVPSGEIDLTKLIPFMKPNSTITIAASVNSGPASEASSNFSWRGDL